MGFLEAHDLSIYFGGLGAIQDLTLCIQNREIVSIIGPNGAGKTTLFNLMTGFLKPTKGKIVYRQEDITGLQPNKIAQRGIVRTFQATKVFPNLTVFQGVRAGCHKRVGCSLPGVIFHTKRFRDEGRTITEEVFSILEFTGLTLKRNALAKDLSYGDQRLLEVAVALGASPEVLLLDEPASGMNPDETNRMIELVAQIRGQGIAVMLVEHNMRMVMGISDRVICLNYGKKIAEGTPKEIQSHPEVIEAYLGKGDPRA